MGDAVLIVILVLVSVFAMIALVRCFTVSENNEQVRNKQGERDNPLEIAIGYDGGGGGGGDHGGSSIGGGGCGGGGCGGS